MPTKAPAAKAPAVPRSTILDNPIDFSETLDADSLSIGGERSSVWTVRLQQLADAVEAGTADSDRFYKLHTYPNATGARTAVRGLEAHPARQPGTFDLRTKVRSVNGTKVSEVWGAVPSPVEDGDGNQD